MYNKMLLLLLIIIIIVVLFNTEFALFHEIKIVTPEKQETCLFIIRLRSDSDEKFVWGQFNLAFLN